MAARYAKSRARSAEVRAELEPLKPGERPRAVTVAAIVAAIMAPANLIATFAVDIGDDAGNPKTASIGISVLLAVAAIGMWRGKYWAVLGFQAMLALQIITLTLALTRVEKLWVAAIVVVVVGAAGFLFWKLVRAMARIQMPQRPQRPAR